MSLGLLLLPLLLASILFGYAFAFPTHLHYSKPILLKQQQQQQRGGGGVVRSPLTCKWIDESVTIHIPGTAEAAYALYSNAENHPIWSPWLREVERLENPQETRWVLASRGVRVSWIAEYTVQDPPHRMGWKSTTGLQNAGLVSFRQLEVEPSVVAMTLRVSYNLPRVLRSIMKLKVVEKIVRRTLLSNLQLFSVELTGQEGSVPEAATLEGDDRYTEEDDALLHPARNKARTQTDESDDDDHADGVEML